MSGFVFDPLSADDEFTQRRRHFEQHARQLREQGIRPGGPRGTVTATDREIVLRIARGEGQEADVMRRLALDPDAVLSEYGKKIEHERETLQNLADRDARRAFEESPEGRKLLAAQLADEQAARTALAERGRLLLASEGTFPAADVEKLNDDEVIAAAGFESSDPTSDDPAANLAAAEGGSDQ